MLRTKLTKLVYLCGLGLLVAMLLPATASNTKGIGVVMFDEKNPAAYRKVEVQKNDKATIQLLHDMGMEEILPYGYGETLWKVPAQQISLLANRPSLKFRDEYDLVGAHGIYFYPELGEPPIQANLRQSKRESYQIWMVKYDNPYNHHKIRKWLEARGIIIAGDTTRTSFLVWLDGKQLAEVEAAVNPAGPILWAGPYHPYYRFADDARPYIEHAKTNPRGTVQASISLVNHAEVETSLAKLRSLAMGPLLFSAGNMGGAPYVGHDLTLPIHELINIANWPDTFLISLHYQVFNDDEMQNQLIAGNITTASEVKPSGPGYLNWLTEGKGFPTNPSAYPLVAIADSGLDIGSNLPTHPDFYQLGSKSNPSRVSVDTCTPDNVAHDSTGHGTLIAGVVGGYNDQTPAIPPTPNPPSVGTNGYNRGIGVSPFGRLLGLRIFILKNNINPVNCANTYAGILTRALSHNAAILNLSANSGTTVYDGNSATFDRFIRSTASQYNRPILAVISGGNNYLRGIGNPTNAKNVISVGATMSTRESTVTDSCGHTGTSNADDVPLFSSRGKTADGRAKPDLVAPGIHIQGPATQSPIFTQGEVCGIPELKRYYPAGQTLYTWSTGTSFAAPAVAGAAQLLYEYYKRVGFSTQEPSPAMAKALLINSARYLALGNAGGDNLPSESQGWGAVNLGTLFSYTPANTFVLDQSVLFSTNNDDRLPFQLRGEVANTNQPLKISLVWSDAPGRESCGIRVQGQEPVPCLQNDLDLEVEVIAANNDSNTYKGNVFTQAFSEPTIGSFDRVNNVENVYIQNPPGATFIVKVIPNNLRGDGVPGNASLLDQDFALVIHNAENVTSVPVPSSALSVGTVTAADNPGGNNNGVTEPNELVTLRVPLTNNASQTAYGVSSLLSLDQAASPNALQTGVTLVSTRSDYPDIPPATSQENTKFNDTSFSLRLDPTYPCGKPVSLVHQTTFNGNLQATHAFTIPVGSLGPGVPTPYDGSAINIPATSTVTATLTIPPQTLGRVSYIKLTMSIDHQDNSNLWVTLYAPNGGKVWLFSQASGSNNFNNVSFDDTVTTTDKLPGIPPPGGYSNHTYWPNQPFADGLYVDNQIPTLAGQWKLEIQNNFQTVTTTGRLKDWKLTLAADSAPLCTNATVKPPAFVSAVQGTFQSGAIGTTFNPLQVQVVDANNVPLRNIAVTFQAPVVGASGSFAGGSRTLVVTTNEDGLAAASGFTANSSTGVYTLTARVNGVTNPAYFVLSNLAGEAASLSVVGGSGQGAVFNSAFGTALVVRVRDSASNPISGQGVTFIPPDVRAGGIAGGSFSGTGDVEGTGWTVFSDENGYATAPTFSANGVGGSYNVIASSGVLTTSFHLYNLAACSNGISPLSVTSTTDDGSGISCGTLSRALLQAVSSTTISFNLGGASVLTITGSLPPLRAGVTLSGGNNCGASLLTLNGASVNSNGLQLEGGAAINNLRIRGFGQAQLVATNGGLGSNKLSCVRIQK